MGFKCAPLGIGTDIGGSIRCPAAFNGAYGFRPTALRNPYNGIILAGEGQESIRCVVGPLASSSVKDLDLFMSAVIDQEPWDIETSLVAIPWKHVELTKEFTVGVLWDDGIVHPHPPITRGLQYAKEKLQAAGIKVVDWKPFDHTLGWDIVVSIMTPFCFQSHSQYHSQRFTFPTAPPVNASCLLNQESPSSLSPSGRSTMHAQRP